MKIRWKLLTLFLAIALVPVTTVSVVSYLTIKNELRKKDTSQLMSVAIKQERHINSLLDSKREDVYRLANKYTLQTALNDVLARKAQTTDHINEVLIDAKANTAEIQTIYLTDLKRNVIASTNPQSIGAAIPEKFLVQPKGQVAELSLVHDDADKKDKLCITISMQINRKDAAILTAVMRTEDLVAAVQDYTGLGSTGETILTRTDDSGNVYSVLPFRHSNEGSYLTTNLRNEQYRHQIDGNFFYATSYRGKNVIRSNKSVSFSTQWVVTVETDVDEIAAPANALGGILVVIVAAVSVIIAVASYISAKKFTGPILRMAQVVRQISSGVFSARIKERRADELGDLAQGVDSMADTITHYIADLQKSHDDIMKDKARLRASIDSLGTGYMMTDLNDNIIIVNEQMDKILSLEHDSADNAVELISAKLQEHINLAATLDQVKATKEAITQDNIIYTDKILRIYVAPILFSDKNDNKKVLGCITIIEDVTEAKALERSKDEFFSIASHELRTPLTAIRGNASMLQSFYPTKQLGESGEEMISDIHESSTRLIDIVNDFLDVSRIEQGKFRYSLTTFSLHEVIEKVVSDMANTVRTKGVDVIFDHQDANDIQVYADRDRIQQVLYNLVGNAVKFTSKGGSVTIAAKQLASHAKVTVRDTGSGIAPEVQHLLFRKFQQAGKSLYTRNTARGTGLGLYICKNMLEQMNGSIRLESSAPGKGSEFSFTVPLNPPADQK